MKITKGQLKQIIKEELEKTLQEQNLEEVNWKGLAKGAAGAGLAAGIGLAAMDRDVPNDATTKDPKKANISRVDDPRFVGPPDLSPEEMADLNRILVIYSLCREQTDELAAQRSRASATIRSRIAPFSKEYEYCEAIMDHIYPEGSKDLKKNPLSPAKRGYYKELYRKASDIEKEDPKLFNFYKDKAAKEVDVASIYKRFIKQ